MTTTGARKDPLDGYLATDTRWSGSVIRDLLVHARRPGVISLAGGLPAPELIATERLAAASKQIFANRGPTALQYGLTSGEPELKQLLAASEGTHPDNIVVTAGSQQALDLVVRVATSPGDAVIIEDPGYVGAIQVLKSHALDLVPVEVDSSGIRTDVLATRLEGGLRPRLCYVNPTHQNPSGAQLSAERSRHLIELAERYGFVIVADDPYVELGFGSTQKLPALLSPQNSEMVVRLGSMSKTLSPGLRIGWLLAQPKLVERVVMAKQGADLHTSTLNQLLVAETISDRLWWSDHLVGLRRSYSQRKDQLAEAIERHLPQAEIQNQDGGFFLWLTFPGPLDTSELLPTAVEAGVAYVPGSAFTVSSQHASAMRLSYSHGDPGQFDQALARLAAAVNQRDTPITKAESPASRSVGAAT